jgi:hypothetical protein
MPRVVPIQLVAAIDQMFPWAANQSEDKKAGVSQGNSREVRALIHLFESIPSELLILEGEEFINLEIAITVLKDCLETWPHRDKMVYGIHGSQKINPITIIRRALARCPDEHPPSKFTELDFLDDAQLRAGLGQDVASIRKALSNGEWKAATVLAGSVVEALLLWALSQCTLNERQSAIDELVASKDLKRPPAPDITEWKAHEYIHVATRLKKITENTKYQALLAKDFRNFIHPGAEVRLQQKCDLATTYSALAAVQHVIRDLSQMNTPH